MSTKKDTRKPGRSPSPPAAGSGFRFGTGLMGATEPGQRVTHRNGSKLPPGSVVRNGDGSRIIHLHDDLWLWCKDGAWCYDRWENLAWRLNKQAVACHVAPNVELSEPGGPVASESGNRVAPPGFAPVSGSAAGRIVKKPQ